MLNWVGLLQVNQRIAMTRQKPSEEILEAYGESFDAQQKVEKDAENQDLANHFSPVLGHPKKSSLLSLPGAGLSLCSGSP